MKNNEWLPVIPAVSLGWRLRSKRHRKNIPLKSMAYRIGIGLTMLQYIENGERVPSEAILVRIAECYEWDENELRAIWRRPAGVIKETATKSGAFHKKVSEFFGIAKDLDENQWDELLDMARSLC